MSKPIEERINTWVVVSKQWARPLAADDFGHAQRIAYEGDIIVHVVDDFLGRAHAHVVKPTPESLAKAFGATPKDDILDQATKGLRQ